MASGKAQRTGTVTNRNMLLESLKLERMAPARWMTFCWCCKQNKSLKHTFTILSVAWPGTKSRGNFQKPRDILPDLRRIYRERDVWRQWEAVTKTLLDFCQWNIQWSVKFQTHQAVFSLSLPSGYLKSVCDHNTLGSRDIVSFLGFNDFPLDTHCPLLLVLHK